MSQIGVRASLAVTILCSLAGCRDAVAPRSGPPASLAIRSGGSFSGVVATQLETPLTVQVADEQDRPVTGATVRFAILRGAGSLSPQSIATDAGGFASTRLTFGIAAGAYQVIATVSGVSGPGHFTGIATAGPAARVVVTPGQARLAAVGDTMRLRARSYDAHGNAVSAAGMTWTAADPDVFTIDQNGLVTGTKALGVGRAVATAGGRADTAFVVVADPGASRCLGYAAPVTLDIGESVTMSLTDGACIRSGSAEEEYVLIPWHGSTAGSSTVTLQLTGQGLAPVTSPQSAEPLGGAPLLVSPIAGNRSRDPRPAFEMERLIRESGRRVVMPRAALARQALAARRASEARTSAVPTTLALGDHIELNANARTDCASPSMRTGRVAAVGSRSIVVDDTANPAGGFTDADYRRFAAAFDTLVAPVDEAAFGAPTDVDRNGKILIFFTRAVNELTPPGADFYFGGFFHPRDLMPRVHNGDALCAGSNEGEMFYLLVPDPTGVVNQNPRRVGFVDSVTVSTLAHEYQHLINAGRRLYVQNLSMEEEVWLNEGLSHIAEELVFYRATGTLARQNVGGDRFGRQPYDGLFVQYMAPNFGRLQAFLVRPGASSPYSTANDLAARGAAWAFLRYAADRRAPADGDVWMRLANSTTIGLANLQGVFGADALPMVRDWAVSVYADDYVAGVGPAFAQPSWNFRTAYPALPASARSYPLGDAVQLLFDGVTRTLDLRGGGAAYYRFAMAPGSEAAVRLTSGGVVPPATVQATILRRR